MNNVQFLAHFLTMEPEEQQHTLETLTALNTLSGGKLGPKLRSAEAEAPKRRGRPSGSKNLPKDTPTFDMRAPQQPYTATAYERVGEVDLDKEV